MPTLDHDGRTIGFVESGAGAPVVLLPPGASSAAAWRRVTDILDKDFKTVAVNPAGYGETAPFRGDRAMSLDDEAGAVLAIIDSLGGKVHLVGHSYGGAIALRIALRAPGRIATLTLIEPALYAVLDDSGETEIAEQVRAVNSSFIREVKAGNSAKALSDYIDFYNGRPGAWVQMSERAQTKLLAFADNIVAGLTASHASPTRLADFAAISLPTLVATGENTDRVHACLARLVADAIPGAGHRIIEGAGHMLSLTHPEEAADLIAGHIADTSSRRD